MHERVFKWVPHSQIESYLMMGWMMTPILMETHHSFYVVMMEWRCNCLPPYPKKESLS